MIPDSLFSPPQSPCFVLLKVPFSSSSEPRFFFLKVPFSPFPDSRSHPLRPLSSSQSPLPSSPIPVSILSVLFLPPPSPLPSSPIHVPILPVLFQSSQSPLPPSSSKPKKTAERHEAVPPFLVVVVGGLFQNGTYQVRKVCLIIH